MNRRVWIGSIATTVAWASFATAQAPSPTVPAGSLSPQTEGPVFVMRTAGQPERRVKVLKSEQLPDGSYLTDVKDLATGAVYTLTNPSVLDSTNKAVTPAIVKAPTAVPAIASPTTGTSTVSATTGYVPPAQPATSPGAPRPLFGSFPNQRQQLPVTMGLPKARDRGTDPLLANQQTPPTLMGKFFNDPLKDQPPPRVGVIPPQFQAQLPVPITAPAKVAAAIPVVAMPAVAPERVVARPEPVAPVLPKSSTQSLVIPNLNVAIPEPEPVAAVAATQPISGQLPKDIQLMIDDLANHKRPSFRMENATSLAESSYAKHPDVIAALLQGAKSDATGVVRGHCIGQLAAIGCSQPEFSQLVEAGMNDAEPAVRRAAANARATLAGRR